MTAGTEALAEAARQEAAAFYSRAAGDTSIATRRAQIAADEAALVASLDRARISRAVDAGATPYDLMLRFRLSQQEARDACRGVYQ
jgi:hypothetical protein